MTYPRGYIEIAPYIDVITTKKKIFKFLGRF